MRMLKDIADIQIGYQHRARGKSIARDSEGSHRIIQIKDVTASSEINSEHLYKVKPKGDPGRYLVDKGDILFLSRGQRTLAVPVREHLNETMAAYYFYILRVNSDLVLPEYLVWFINQPTSQIFLESRRRGSYIKMIPKVSFGKLEVHLPPLHTQKTIVELERLRRKEEQTMRRLIDARRRLINALSLQTVREKNLVRFAHNWNNGVVE